MRWRLRAAYQAELDYARMEERAARFDTAFARLERAHVLAQRFVLPHARVHVKMLRSAWRQRDAREVAGQIARILAALMLSRIWVPTGNTGGANVGAFAPMTVPPDLTEVLGDG